MATLRRYTNLAVLLDMLFHSRIRIVGYDKWEDQNDRHSMETYQRALHYGFVGALCLTEAAETFHHWRVFSPNETGVCIAFNKKKFVEALPTKHIKYGKMQYCLLDKITAIDATDIHKMPFLKRYGFKDEKEYRVVGYKVEKDPPYMDLPLEFSSIESIIVNPFLHRSLAQSIKNTIRQMSHCSNLSFAQSTLTSNDRWKEAIEDYEIRHGSIYSEWLPIDLNSGDES